MAICLPYRAGILSVAGWLLMLAPTTKQDGKVTPNFDAPLSEWYQDSAHDTARDCEAEREKMANIVAQRAGWDVARHYVKARCVPAELVYPPKKPEK
jgi:hypothetical protein